MKGNQDGSKSKKKSLSAIAMEIEEESYFKSEESNEYKPAVNARTLIRNFNAILATLNQPEGRFKNDRNWYVINEGTEPLLKAMLIETTIKGSYFYYAKQNRAEEAANEEIIATYKRIHNQLRNEVDEKRLKNFLKLTDKVIGYSFAVEQQKIQKELANYIATIESLKYPQKVKKLREVRKEFSKLIEESKKVVEKEVSSEEMVEKTKNK